MAGGVSLSVRLSPQWRDGVGRFSRSPVKDSIEANLQNLGGDALSRLVHATPIGKAPKAANQHMRNSWRQSYMPSSLQLRITNLQLYWAWVALTGTRYMRPNPELQRVITQELPEQAQVTTRDIGREILLALKV